MHAAPIMILVLCAFALGYRHYSAFLAAKARDIRISINLRWEKHSRWQPVCNHNIM